MFTGLLRSSSPTMWRVYPSIRAASESNLTVLVSGESGTGKELVASMVHRSSKRAKGPFIPVNCAAIPRDLLEAELFGYRKGAFTGSSESGALGLFRSAQGGTLFLDEIGEMPLDAQVKLLRVLQERSVRPVGDTQLYPVDVRIIVATNQDLARRVTEGRFRLDLYYRINTIQIELPPLRERIEDLQMLIDVFRARIAHRQGVDALPDFAPEALALMKSYGWPGNLRELENLLEASAVIARGAQIQVEHLPAHLRSSTRLDVRPARSHVPTMHEMECEFVREVLQRVGNNKSKAARVLGISRSRLYSLLDATPGPEAA